MTKKGNFQHNGKEKQKNKQVGSRKSAEVIYGKNACFGCFEGNKNGTKSREIFEILILQNKFDEYIKKVPQNLQHLIKKCNNHDLFVLTHEQDKHQGIACRVSGFRFADIEKFLTAEDRWKKGEQAGAEQKAIRSCLFLLDRVQDPHNVGNIIRSAFCFGIDGLILPERDACGITPAVVRTSAGYSEQLPIYQVGNIVNALEKLKKVGFWIVGFDVNTNTKDSLTDIVGKYDKCVFIFGAEGDGMRDLTKKQCDILIRLPMAKGAESLNVANTVAIVGWETIKKNLHNKLGHLNNLCIEYENN